MNYSLKNKKILHVAPEENLSKYLKNLSTSYISIDLHDKDVMIKMDVTNLEFKDKMFDLILCNHVLEHIQDDIKAMKELYRVLNNNGLAILQVPISYQLEKTFEDFSIVEEKERLMNFGQEDHVRIYGQDYFDRLKSVGFQVHKLYEPSEIGFNASFLRRTGLIENEKLIICFKQ
ncbi:unnamed protein product [marine sediment metagenome]|uniref:Methyltransferase type 11 domain-containing protein n=1 Tax=marine sediment metagenome TaxID=412755 RepID=X1C700_9ZZZZ